MMTFVTPHLASSRRYIERHEAGAERGARGYHREEPNIKPSAEKPKGPETDCAAYSLGTLAPGRINCHAKPILEGCRNLFRQTLPTHHLTLLAHHP